MRKALHENESRNHCRSSWLNSELAGMKVMKSYRVILSHDSCRCNSLDCCCCCCSWISKTLRTSKVRESHKFNWEWLEDAFMVLLAKKIVSTYLKMAYQFTLLMTTDCTYYSQYTQTTYHGLGQSIWVSFNLLRHPGHLTTVKAKKNGTSGTSSSTSKLLVVTAEKVPTASLILYKRQCHFGSLPQAGSRVP